MNTRTTSLSLFYRLLFLSLLSLLAIASANAEDADDNGQNDYGYMGMGHGYMGNGYMGMGYGNRGMGYGNMRMGPMGMGSGYMGSGHMGMGFGYFHMLDLTDAQRKTIRNIYKDSRTQQFALQDKVADLSDELSTLYKEDKPNPKKISEVYKKIFDIKRQQIELRISTQNKAYDVLTIEQKDKLKEWKSSGNYHQYRGGQGYGNMPRMMQ